MAAPLKPNITLYSLEASRSIRTAWLLEELGLDYEIVSSARAPDFLAPPEFKKKIPGYMGKSPTITDNGLVVQESIAISDYICEYYDTAQRMIPADRALKSKVREFVAASESTFMMHALPMVFAKWRITDEKSCNEFLDKGTPSVQKDLDWLEHELGENLKRTGGPKLFLVGSDITAADPMVYLSIDIILKRQIGVKDLLGSGRWKLVEQWAAEMEAREAYKRAVEKTNFRMITG